MLLFFMIILGFIIGALNYFVLMHSVKNINSKNKQYYAPLSFFVRTIVVLFFFWLFMDGDWKRAIFLLIGFVLSKIVIIFLVKKNYIRIENL